MSHVAWLDTSSLTFPPSHHALKDPNGLLAVGGDLSCERLLHAYSQGIFPWYNVGEPILWWTPDPRCALRPSEVHLSRSMRKLLRQNRFDVSFNRCFPEVMRLCANTREQDEGTWINQEMLVAYGQLAQKGYAQSVEVWHQDQLVGGLYGISIGKVFFGESMFSLMSNASKVAFIHLCRQLERLDFLLIDCQVASEHLHSLGAYAFSRADFETLLKANLREHGPKPCKLPSSLAHE